MTHTLMPWNKLTVLEEHNSLKRLKANIQSCLEAYAPEYVSIYREIDPLTLDFMLATLSHWEKNLDCSRHERKRFLQTKLVEHFAFMAGYAQGGGTYSPFATYSNKLVFKIRRCTYKRNIRRIRNHNRIVAVIPIGHLNSAIEKILQKTLVTLDQNKSISKIYCVFDGCKPQKNFQSRKTEIIEVSQRKGPANARNIGIEKALSTNMSDALFIDSDVTLSSEMLNQLIDSYGHFPEGIACPKISADGTSWWDKYHDVCGTLNGRYFRDRKMNQLLFGTTSCMLAPRVIFESELRFSTDFSSAAGEDIDFCLNARSSGYAVYPVDDIRVKHWFGYCSNSFDNWSVFKERFRRYGEGEVRLLKRHPGYYSLLTKTTERSS